MYNDLLTIGKVTLHGYGLMIGLGFVFAVLLAQYRCKRYDLDKNHVLNLGITVLICGFLGGKLLHVITNFSLFIEEPLRVLGSEGFVVYGGLITGVFSGWVYARVNKLDFLKCFDLVLPSVALAQGFGRLGCFLAGCCYGKETDAWFGVTFPAGSLGPSNVKVIPTQIFSSIGDFLLAAILVLYARKAKKGNTGALYFILYGIGRYIVEIFRDDERGTVGMFSTSQFISIFFVVIGIGLFIWNAKREK